MRPKGSIKTPGSGRKRGTPNRSTQRVLDLCLEVAGTEPVIVLAKALLDPEQCNWAADKLMPYCYPKPVADGEQPDAHEPPIAISQEQLLELVDKARARK